MTVIRAKNERRIVLDFSDDKLSKNKIKQALRDLEISILEYSPENNTNTFIQNEIKVGMYIISVCLGDMNIQSDKYKLRDFGIMNVSIRENNSFSPIDVYQDGRFKKQYWCQTYPVNGLKIKHLVDIIHHCRRLDNLKIFL